LEELKINLEISYNFLQAGPLAAGL